MGAIGAMGALGALGAMGAVGAGRDAGFGAGTGTGGGLRFSRALFRSLKMAALACSFFSKLARSSDQPTSCKLTISDSTSSRAALNSSTLYWIRLVFATGNSATELPPSLARTLKILPVSTSYNSPC